MLEKILEHNKKFVEERKARGEDKPASSHARKEIMVFTCMDTRLVDLLEKAMGFERGDIKILKNAGNIIREGCNDVIRCISIGTTLMGIKEVYIVGHKDCGMRKQTPESVRNKMIEKGILQEALDSIDIAKWAGLIKDEKENVLNGIKMIKGSPYIPKDVKIFGLLMDPDSGEIEVIYREDC